MEKQKSRTEMAARNVVWAYSNTIVTTILKFICRWAFIQTIGATYLGIHGLYTSVLGVLSLTELGIGTAMNYSLYKPVAERDIEKIKSLMLYYKKAYRVIAVVISVLGLALVPFLPYLIKGADGVDHLTLYYLLFLFNTVSSYFVSYKYSLNSAEQKAYIVNNITTVTNIVMNILQIIALFVMRSFLIYLIIQIVCLLLSKIFASFYLSRQYPYLDEKDVKPLDKESKTRLFTNVKALVIHKLGDVAVNQTDNIIISSLINVKTTGLISNYTLITSTVDSFLFILFNNIIGSLGNLCATQSKERQLSVFHVYDFASYWLFGFAAIAYASLMQPFTSLMWGPEYVVDFNVILLIIINTYIVGQRIPLNNMKTASGLFVQDKFIPAIQAAVNLVVSIVLVKTVGLIGVYIGTIISGLVPTIIRPVLVYRAMFGKSVMDYFKTFSIHAITIGAIGILNCFICGLIMKDLTWLTFFMAVAETAIVPNAIIFLLHRKSMEITYVKEVAQRLLKKLKKA